MLTEDRKEQLILPIQIWKWQNLKTQVSSMPIYCYLNIVLSISRIVCSSYYSINLHHSILLTSTSVFESAKLSIPLRNALITHLVNIVGAAQIIICTFCSENMHLIPLQDFSNLRLHSVKGKVVNYFRSLSPHLRRRALLQIVRQTLECDECLNYDVPRMNCHLTNQIQWVFQHLKSDFMEEIEQRKTGYATT